MLVSQIATHSNARKQCLVGFLYAVGTGELIIRLVEQKSSKANMAIEYFQCAKYYHVSISGPKEKFQN